MPAAEFLRDASEALSRREQRRGLETELLMVRARAELEEGKKLSPDTISMLNKEAPTSYTAAMAAACYFETQGNLAEAVEAIETFLTRCPITTPEQRRVYGHSAGELATLLEMQWRLPEAMYYYRRAYYVAGIDMYLPEHTWRHCSALMAQGRWDEAYHMIAIGSIVLWKFFAKLTGRGIRRRLQTHTLIPDRKAVFLGCLGIGDELFRLALLADLRKPGVQYAYTCDPRVTELFRRSFPDIEFIPDTRVGGRGNVSEAAYWQSREGIPYYAVETGRITKEIWTKIKEYGEIALTEDLVTEYIRLRCPKTKRGNEPLLVVPPDLRKRARVWLDSLPGTLKVGISWRSGVRDVSRNRSYTDILWWREILMVEDVSFFSVQYSDTTEELREVEAEFGVKIHVMPGLDLKDDFGGVGALCAEADLIIAPCTAVRELSGMVGARTWCLTTTPAYPDLWHIDEDGETDSIFPTLRHFTAQRYGNHRGGLAAVAKELALLRDSQRAPLQTAHPEVLT